MWKGKERERGKIVRNESNREQMNKKKESWSKYINGQQIKNHRVKPSKYTSAQRKKIH